MIYVMLIGFLIIIGYLRVLQKDIVKLKVQMNSVSMQMARERIKSPSANKEILPCLP